MKHKLKYQKTNRKKCRKDTGKDEDATEPKYKAQIPFKAKSTDTAPPKPSKTRAEIS